jgi:hypothetical protein
MLSLAEQKRLRLLTITVERLRIRNPEVLRKQTELWEKASDDEKAELYLEIILADAEDWLFNRESFVMH